MPDLEEEGAGNEPGQEDDGASQGPAQHQAALPVDGGRGVRDAGVRHHKHGEGDTVDTGNQFSLKRHNKKGC